MADKANFTPDEWKLLLESVVMASMAVTAADPSGLFGLIKEGLAGGSTLAQARMGTGTNPLIKAVVDDFSTSGGRAIAQDGVKQKISGKQLPEVKALCIQTLQQAAAVLDAKAPSDAAAFKNWLHQLSQNVAEAASEGGGLFGIGGVPVSDAEKATLAEISSALKLAA